MHQKTTFTETLEKNAHGIQGLDERHGRTLSVILGRLEEPGWAEHVRAVILYGSCAKGRARYGSDVDLLIELTEVFKETDGYKRKALDLISAGHDMTDGLPEADIRIQFGDSWRNNTSSYYKNIRKDGISVWI